MGLFRIAVTALAVSIAPTTAIAQSASDISGNWSFRTGDYYDGCRITGEMVILPTEQAGVLACEFTTHEVCPGLEGQIRQSCTAQVSGKSVRIDSQLTEIIHQSPQPYGYSPDNWSLEIQTRDRMTGQLDSAARALVIFERFDPPIS